MNNHPFIPFKRKSYEAEEMIAKSKSYYEWMNQRRTVRDFSDKPVPKAVIENIILTASTAPSGAHMQPWSFCAVGSAEVKKEIRIAAEEEERINYSGRMSDSWLEDLAHLGTDENKPFLEIAPWLIIVFRQIYRLKDGKKLNNYYVNESVGLAAGFLLSAVHEAGLVALTHTPSPMKFLNKILDRPENERPFLLIPVGYPAEDATVPDLTRKSLEEVAQFFLNKK